MVLQTLDQENPPYTSAVHELARDGYVSVLRMRDLGDVLRMGLGGPLVVEVAALVSVSAIS